MGHLIRHLIDHYGYAIVVVLVFAEGVGLPLPGETALITAAAFAAQSHRLSIIGVVIASIVGATAGGVRRLLDRKRGRTPLSASGMAGTSGSRRERIANAKKFFTEHGPKAVFAARFIAILRMFAGVLAGVTKMRFWVFFLWNLLGAHRLVGAVRHARLRVRQQAAVARARDRPYEPDHTRRGDRRWGHLWHHRRSRGKKSSVTLHGFGRSEASPPLRPCS